MGEDRLSVRKSIVWNAAAFGVVLAIIIGIRLEQAALTAVVGVVCGVGASIPTGLLVVMLLRRRDDKQRARVRESQQPPVVVVTAPTAPAQLPQGSAWPGAFPTALPPAQREFSVIGEEGIDDEFDYWQD